MPCGAHWVLPPSSSRMELGEQGGEEEGLESQDLPQVCA